MADGKGVLAVLEAGEGVLSPISPELLRAGRALADALGGPLVAVLAGEGITGAAGEAGEYGADWVLVADGARLRDYVGDVYLQVLERAVERATPSVILIGQTASGRELAPRLAFRLGAGLTTDCTELRVE